MHDTIVIIHVLAAILAVGAGPLAVRFPNGTPRHRTLGRLYVAAWVVFGTTGLYLGGIRPGISPFEILTVLGAGFVGVALYVLWRRQRIGPSWKRHHYRAMLISYAFVAIATLNQVLIHAGLEYPLWVFGLIALLPFAVLPRIRRRLDQQYAVPVQTNRPPPV